MLGKHENILRVPFTFLQTLVCFRAKYLKAARLKLDCFSWKLCLCEAQEGDWHEVFKCTTNTEDPAKSWSILSGMDDWRVLKRALSAFVVRNKKKRMREDADSKHSEPPLQASINQALDGFDITLVWEINSSLKHSKTIVSLEICSWRPVITGCYNTLAKCSHITIILRPWTPWRGWKGMGLLLQNRHCRLLLSI